MGNFTWNVSSGGALALSFRMGEFCSMPRKLGWPYWAVCMSGLVVALVIFRSSSASLMGPWGPINALRPCVQDTKVEQSGRTEILLGSLILQRFRDKKFTRPTDYHQLTSPSQKWSRRKDRHKQCFQSKRSRFWEQKTFVKKRYKISYNFGIHWKKKLKHTVWRQMVVIAET